VQEHTVPEGGYEVPVQLLRAQELLRDAVHYNDACHAADPNPRANVARSRYAAERHVHSSVMEIPNWPSRRRTRGRLMPITLPWSPSMPSMKGAERPSRVNAPAT
jgi:hypothetical protein